MLDGGRTAILYWVPFTSGCIFPGFVGFDKVAEQEKSSRNLPVLAQLLIGALLVVRGAESLPHGTHKTLATLLRLLSVAVYVAVFVVLRTSLYSTFGLLRALIGLGLFAGVVVLSIHGNRKRLQSGNRTSRRQPAPTPAASLQRFPVTRNRRAGSAVCRRS